MIKIFKAFLNLTVTLTILTSCENNFNPDLPGKKNTDDKIIFADKSPPSFTSVPVANGIGGTSFILSGKINESGFVNYWIESSKDKICILRCGKIYAVKDVDFGQTIHSPKLIPSETYDVYISAEDYMGNITPYPQQISVMMGEVDLSPPVRLESEVLSLKSDSVTASCTLDEPGRIFGLVLSAGSEPPSSEQVKTGVYHENSSIISCFNRQFCGGISTLTINNLTPETDYDLYLAYEDDEELPNISAYPDKIPFTTISDDPLRTPPEWKSGYPKYNSITAQSFKYYVSQTKNGKIYIMVVTSGVTPPTIEELKAQKNYGSVSVLYKTIKNAAADREYYSTISGLTPATSYDIYAVGENENGVIMNKIHKSTVTTGL